jgi:hypothetical protein
MEVSAAPPRSSNPVVRLPCDPWKFENEFMYFSADPEYNNPLYHWKKSVLRRKGLTRYPKYKGNIEVSELNDRGWVLQERILIWPDSAFRGRSSLLGVQQELCRRGQRLEKDGYTISDPKGPVHA